MTENLTAKQIEYVTKLVKLAGSIDAILDECAALSSDYPFMGDLATADIWTNGNIQHTDAADIATFKSRLDELVTWFNSNLRRDIVKEVKK